MEYRTTWHSAVSAFMETVEFLERSLASMLMRYSCSIIGCYFFSRHNRFAETHSYLQLSNHILSAGNELKYHFAGVNSQELDCNPYQNILLSRLVFFSLFWCLICQKNVRTGTITQTVNVVTSNQRCHSGINSYTEFSLQVYSLVFVELGVFFFAYRWLYRS